MPPLPPPLGTPVYEWASDNIPEINFKFCTLDDYKRAEFFLQDRFQRSKTIPGTQKLHCFFPLTNTTLRTKPYSNSSIQKEEKVALVEADELPSVEINEFVAVVHDEMWWIGCIHNVYKDSKSIKIDLLCPQGPSQSFKYPSKQNIVVVPYSDVLIKVNPRTVTGRIYTISKQESKTATDKFKARKKHE